MEFPPGAAKISQTYLQWIVLQTSLKASLSSLTPIMSAVSASILGPISSTKSSKSTLPPPRGRGSKKVSKEHRKDEPLVNNWFTAGILHLWRMIREHYLSSQQQRNSGFDFVYLATCSVIILDRDDLKLNTSGHRFTSTCVGCVCLSHETHRFVDWVLSAPFLLACIPLSSCTRQGPYSWWSHLCLCQTPWTPHVALQRRCTDGWVREMERFILVCIIGLVCSLLWCCSTVCVCVLRWVCVWRETLKRK